MKYLKPRFNLFLYTWIRLHILVSSSCAEGPGNDGVWGPGNDGFEGPGNDGVEGPGNGGVEGLGNIDVSPVDGGVDGDNISSFTIISFTFESVEKESLYSPINEDKMEKDYSPSGWLHFP